MSLGGQAKLLRVLEQKLITKVGGSEAIPVNVRIVAATNSNLTEAVREKRFREDLYYRLSVVTLDLPPLRDRPEDILLLAEHFLARFAAQARRPSMQFTADARRRLQAHAWPGNVRELRNRAERYVLMGPSALEDSESYYSTEVAGRQTLAELVDAFERSVLENALQACQGSIKDTMVHLGLARKTLYDKMKKHGLDKARFKDDGGTD